MYLYTHDRIECCGCGGCRQICPQHCISMVLRSDGFKYPAIDQEHCVKCGKCVVVCPIHQANNRSPQQQLQNCFYGWHKNSAIRLKSTSGGTFTAIAEQVLKNSKSAIYGALYDENWTVRHSGATELSGLEQLRQSKYVQSEIGDCYIGVKDRLENDEYVLFCGTPCQVDGLRCYLGEEYENLLLVDLICHGVTSPAVFKKYIESLETKEGQRVKKVRFRDKVKKGNVLSLSHTTIVFENGATKSSSCNLYLRAYMKGLMQRQCCEKCPYSSPVRISDVTIGDFWGIENIISQLSGELSKGLSLILANTKKGRLLCGKLTGNMNIVETEVSYAFNGNNKQLEKPIEATRKKIDFYQNVLEDGVILALLKGLGVRSLVTMYYRCAFTSVKAYLPQRVYRLMVFLKRSLS